MNICKYHRTQYHKCKWCRKWKRTYKYFKNLKASKLTVYCVEMEHYRTREKFYKVGLTTGTVEQRFNLDMERFKVKTINQEIHSVYEAVTIETETLYRMYKEKRTYRPKARFSGWTECFR